ncbi:MAG: hypothetical protein ACUBOA_06070 [Candidatus Loosdrechtia sp.]|uniref:hypothetical protein n=1 Tax=Candidatus Loosdrechtia sp. TaxID=3101272 RepID=UPI003A6A9042|nr:MAG: hypothetical protein QY305_09200 [Candidatus Jettenia sp. AMX2]
MRNFYKIIGIIALCLVCSSVTYFMFGAVARSYSSQNPQLAKKIVVLTFLVNISMVVGCVYLIYKLKDPAEKK